MLGFYGLKYSAFAVIDGVATPMRHDLPQLVDEIRKTEVFGLQPRIPTSDSGLTSEASLPPEFG